MIYFGASDTQHLANTVVLDPAWLAARMTDLISFKQNWQNGVVDMARLCIIWKQYDQARRDEILSLLERFHVVFFKRSRGKKGIVEAGEVIVPCLLPEAIDLSSVSRGLRPEAGLLLRRESFRSSGFLWALRRG